MQNVFKRFSCYRKNPLNFDTVGLVIWLVKIVPEMTYNALSGTLSLYTTTMGVAD